MSRIFLVRHGETIWHAENRYAGSSDIALTARGLQQANALADWAREASLTHLYVSSMSRARATAEPSAAATGLAMQTEPRLREVDFGNAEGLTAAELKIKFPQQFSDFLHDPATHFLPSGENPVDAVRRGRSALDEIAATCGPSSRVLVVAHNTLIRLLLCDIIGISLDRYRSLFPVLNNAALTEIVLGEGAPSLLSFNAPLQQSHSR